MNLSGFQSTSDKPERHPVSAREQGFDAKIPRLDLNPRVQYQTHLGFGGAFTEAAAVNYASLNDAEKARFNEGYFCPEKGLGYNLCRLHLNSCDFSLGNWACQPTETANFSLDRYQQHILPMIRDAQRSLGHNIELLISPWSPPDWMKSNGQMNLGGHLKAEYRDSWAQHYVQFIQLLQSEGLSVWGLTVQNEPEATQSWDSCLYSAEDERDFIRDHLGPALEQAGLSEIRILCWDHNRDHLYHRASTVLSDEQTASYIWGSAFHWYMDDCFDNVQAVHDAFPDKGLLFTEGCQEGGPHPGSWAVAERYSHAIINDLRRWTAGWIDWNLALDTDGGPNHVGNNCSAPALIDQKSGSFDWQPSYQALSHFARSIPPGSVRILSAAGFDGLEHLAFLRPDGDIVLVVLNVNDQSQQWQLVSDDQSFLITTPAHALQSWRLSQRE